MGIIPLTYTCVDPADAAALSTGVHLTTIPFNCTLVGVTVVPLEDDAGATLDIQDDGSDIVTAVDASDADVPGSWLSVHLGGANAPVHIAADSKLSADFNNAAAANAFQVTLYVLPGSLT